jgi:two-component system, LytTR family, sensor histidine kinase AgrC
MFGYDVLAIVLTGISHVLIYIYFIRYNRMSYPLVIAISVVLTILIALFITLTGYPEFNFLLVLFLIGLGLMQEHLHWIQNLYFALASMVSITLVKMIAMQLGMTLFMLSPFHLYIWTLGVIHLLVSLLILATIVLCRNQIRRLAAFMIHSKLYYVSYVCFVIGILLIMILTFPSTNVLGTLYEQFGQASYKAAYIVFLILVLIILIGAHLSKERAIEQQQKRLDEELLIYVKKLEQMHDELSSFRHDYMNILLSLEEGVRTKNITHIEQVYYDVIAPTSVVINNQEWDIVKLSRISVPEVKSVLSVKLLSSPSINVMIDIPHVIEQIYMPTLSFIRTISILLDNAVEEALQSEEKVVQVAFFETDDTQYFIMRNSCKKRSVDLQQIYEKQYSSKDKCRGYGLFSLKKIIEKTDHATLETSFVAPYFSQTIMMKKDHL